MPDKSDSTSPVFSLIGSRTLQRNMKEVLDHIEQVGEPVVILRYGRPAAALVPIGEDEAKMLLLAGSIRESREEGAAGEQSQTEPFAVSEREIVGETTLDSGPEQRVTLEATDRAIEAAAEGLTFEIGGLAEVVKARRAYGGKVVTSGRTLAELLEIQAETLRSLANEVVHHEE